MGIEIKGTKEGFSVITDNEYDFLETRTKLLQKFEESKDFFKGTKFIGFIAPNLNKADKIYLKNLLEELYDVKFDEQENHMEESMVKITEYQDCSNIIESESSIEKLKEKLTSFDETIDKIKEITAKKENHISETSPNDDNLKTKFIFENLRSGAEVEYDGNIVIFGDVNPGAKITAKGNIIVLGSFRGVAYAGKENDGCMCFLAALKLLPLQIRIQNLFAVPPQDAKIIENAIVKQIEDQIVIEHF